MTNFYKKLVKSLLVAGLLVAPLQNYAAAAGPFSDNRESGLDSDNEVVDQVHSEVAPELITLKFIGSDQSVEVPRGALMRSQLGKAAFELDPESTELSIRQLAGFTLKELAKILQVTDWQKYLENKDDVYLYRLLLLERYLGMPNLYEALTTGVAHIIPTMPAEPEASSSKEEEFSDEEVIFAQDSAKKFTTNRTLNTATDDLISVGWSANGSQIVSGSHDNTVRIWDTATGNLISSLAGYPRGKKLRTPSPDGTMIAVGSNFASDVYIFDAATGNRIRTFDSGADRIFISVLWSPDGSMLAENNNDNKIRIWNPLTGELRATLDREYNNSQSVLAWSSDSKKLAIISGDENILMWNRENGELQTILVPVNIENTDQLAWSPDSKNIAFGGSSMNKIRILDVLNGQIVSTFKLDSSGLLGEIAWSPDGNHIASPLGQSAIGIWNVKTNQLVRTLNGHNHKVLSLAWSPDGLHIVSSSKDTVHIWSVISLEQKQKQALRWIREQEEKLAARKTE